MNGPTESIIDICQQEFEATRNFWLTFVVEPDMALRTAFPKIVSLLQKEAKAIKPNSKPQEPVDIYLGIISITELFKGKDRDGDPPFGREDLKLPYDPIQAFGEDGIAAIVDHGIQSLNQTPN